MPLPKWSWQPADTNLPDTYPEALRSICAVADGELLAKVERDVRGGGSPEQRWGWRFYGNLLDEAQRSGLADGAVASGRADFADREEAKASCEVAIAAADRAIDAHMAKRERVPSWGALQLAAARLGGMPMDVQPEGGWTWKMQAQQVFDLAEALDDEHMRRGWTRDARGADVTNLDGEPPNVIFTAFEAVPK